MKHRTEIARRYLFTASLVLAAAALVPACGDDDHHHGDEPDASSGGGTSTGGKGSGGSGTGGKSTGGVANTGGAAPTGGVANTGGAVPTGGVANTGGANGTGGDKPDASVDGGPDSGTGGGGPDTGTPDDGGGAPFLPSVVLAGVTDYASTTIVSTIDVAGKKKLGESTFTDGDTIPVVSDGRPFAVERTTAAVNLLTATGAVGKRISLQEHDGGTERLNPQTVVVVPGTSKAFVPLYNVSAVAVLDLDLGEVTARLDFSGLKAEVDTDGSADIGGGVFDAKRNRVYFVAQRVDLHSGSLATDYAPVCSGDDSALIAVDAASNAIVDLNGAAEGTALPLKLVGPTNVVLDAENDWLVLLSTGCDEIGDGGKGYRTRHGIETVNLGTLATNVAYQETKNVYLANLLLLAPGRAIVESQDIANFYASSFYAYGFGNVLGGLITGVPGNPVVLNSSALLGLASGATADGGTAHSVVHYDADTKAVTSLVDFEWPAKLTSSVGVVVVK